MSTAQKAKQVVYIYNGDGNDPDKLLDLDGEIPIPANDSIIDRRNKKWKVVRHSVETSGKDSVPAVIINLTDQGL